jgi:5'-nucleotidase
VSSPSRRLLAVATATLLGAPLLAVTPAVAADPVTVNLIGINDFHGRIDANTVKFAGTVEQLRAEEPTGSLLISAGDNVSASLFTSSVQKDIPTIDVLNALDLDASAAGNHEFDQGADDLTGRLSQAATFPFLSANTFKADKTPLLKKYETFSVNGVDVAVVGAVTEETPSLVSPAGIQGLTFADPVESINDTVDELEALPADKKPDVIVASIHEGAPDGKKTLEENAAASPVFKEVVEKTDPRVDAIFMGHTHQAYAYDAPIPGQAGKTRPILQTGNYGSNVGQIKLTIDPASGEVVSYTKKNQARTTTADGDLVAAYPRVAAVKTVVDAAIDYAAQIGNQKVGSQTGDLSRAYNGTTEDRGAESNLSNLIAESMRISVGKTSAGADIGLNNAGGVRADLLFAKGSASADSDGTILYGEALGVLTFANQLSTVTMTGSVLKEVLEQQWQRNADGTVPTRAYLQMGMSKNMSYTFDATRAEGDRITSITIDGKRVTPDQSIKVAVPSFLTSGGDNFRAFTKGTAADSGLVDYTGFNDYLATNSPITPDFSRHAVEVRGVKSSYKAGSAVSVSLPKLDLTSLNSPKNTTVAASITSGGTTTKVGDFPVTAGAAAVDFALPPGVTGDVTLTLTAAPTSTTVAIPLSVEKLSTTTTATAPAKAKTGTTFTVEATVDGETDAVPTGAVTVKDGDTVLATEPLAGGKASIAVNASNLSADEHALTVAYSGDATHAPSTAAAGTVDIVKGGSGFGAVAASGTYGRTSIVSVTADSAASGLVYVARDGQPLGLGFMLNGKGSAAIGGTVLAPGTHALDVFYNGDEKFDPTATTASITIAKGATSVRKASVSPTKIVRKRTRAVVTLSVKGDGFVVDGGTVTVRQGGKSYRATVKNGKARVRLGTFTSSGSKKKVTASYSGNGVANGSSTGFTVKVVKK